jgi:hypothetical protein
MFDALAGEMQALIASIVSCAARDAASWLKSS